MDKVSLLLGTRKKEAAPPSPRATAEAVRRVVPYLETRRCLTRVVEALEGVGGRSVAVLSFEAGEGRTVTTLALAAAAADRGLKTLVLDATTFERLGAVSLEETLGVAEASGTGPQASPVFPGVDYVTCFVRDGIRLAEGRAELERLTQGYDLALIDTAALNTHNRGNVDPQLCARLADGALLVAAGDGPLAEGSKATIDDMKRLGVRFFGVVGNGASR